MLTWVISDSPANLLNMLVTVSIVSNQSWNQGYSSYWNPSYSSYGYNNPGYGGYGNYDYTGYNNYYGYGDYSSEYLCIKMHLCVCVC